MGVAAIVAPAVGGCAKAPSLNVAGAYFPDWMFCIIAGVVLSIACYLLIGRAASGDWLGPSAVTYPALVTLFSLLAWLILFRH
ncbi:hypothetical protein AU476_28755 [Cupriavidus sp. UYMSc13B]|nr:hypothetical protein AU476_28755 [Cupriavidus sp. UYMSc13B]